MRTVRVALTAAAYVPLSSGANYVGAVTIPRGARLRLCIAATGATPVAGATDYIPLEGPTKSDDYVKVFDLRNFGIGASDEAYMRSESANVDVTVIRGT